MLRSIVRPFRSLARPIVVATPAAVPVAATISIPKTFHFLDNRLRQNTPSPSLIVKQMATKADKTPTKVTHNIRRIMMERLF
jgi:hypothetical protein